MRRYDRRANREGVRIMGAILRLISNRGFIAVNKQLAKMYGLDEAVLLGELAGEFEYWEARGEVEDGFFYSTVENVQENTTLSDRRQRSAIKTLKEAGIISMQVRGLPPKRYFSIDEERLLQELSLANAQNQFLHSARIEPCKTQELNLAECKTNNNTSNDNKKENKKESKKESKKEERKTFDELIDEYTENDELRTSLREYVKMRVAKKQRPTNHALELVFKELDKLGRDDAEKVAIVNQSIMRSWTGVFPLKSGDGYGGQQSPRSTGKYSNFEGCKIV